MLKLKSKTFMTRQDNQHPLQYLHAKERDVRNAHTHYPNATATCLELSE